MFLSLYQFRKEELDKQIFNTLRKARSGTNRSSPKIGTLQHLDTSPGVSPSKEGLVHTEQGKMSSQEQNADK